MWRTTGCAWLARHLFHKLLDELSDRDTISFDPLPVSFPQRPLAAETPQLAACLQLLRGRPLKLIAEARHQDEKRWVSSKWTFQVHNGRLATKDLLDLPEDHFQFSVADAESRQQPHKHLNVFELYISDARIEIQYKQPDGTSELLAVESGAVLVPPSIEHDVKLHGLTFVVQCDRRPEVRSSWLPILHNKRHKMNELTVVEKANEWRRMKSLVLDSVSSPITKRVYNMALDEFFGWYAQEPRPGFTKATVSAWRVTLEERGLGSSSIIVRMSAIRKLAVEATDNGLLAPELAAGIQRVKSAKSIGVRAGNWLSLKQAQALLNAPDISTLKGLRDRAIIAVLLGCALRRSEVAALTMAHVQQRDGRWCIVDLYGKHGRVRTIPMPVWVKVAMDAWTARAGVGDGYVFRPVIRGDQVRGGVMCSVKK
jgi:hypothetical protein